MKSDPKSANRLDDAVNRAELLEVKTLLDSGVSSDCRNVVGETPLMSAAWVGADAIVELLIARGADAHALDREGKNALQRLLANTGYWYDGHDRVAAILRHHGVKE